MADVMDGVQERERHIHNAHSRRAAVSAFTCEFCAAPIPEARRVAISGFTHCVTCQEVAELKNKHYKGI